MKIDEKHLLYSNLLESSFNCSTPQHIRLLPLLLNSLKKAMEEFGQKLYTDYRLANKVF